MIFENEKELQDSIYQTDVIVEGGQLAVVEVITEPYKTPTPQPVGGTPTPTLSPTPEG